MITHDSEIIHCTRIIADIISASKRPLSLHIPVARFFIDENPRMRIKRVYFPVVPR